VSEPLYRKRTISAESLLGTQFEPSTDGWCKHCHWAQIAHFIRASDGALLCQKDGEVFAVASVCPACGPTDQPCEHCPTASDFL
jgi:hypothetical protein